MSNTKRIKTLQPILLAGEQIPRPVGYVAEVSEGEANALIASGYAAATTAAVSTDGATQIEGFQPRLPADLKPGSLNTDGTVVPHPEATVVPGTGTTDGEQARANIAAAQKEAGLSTKAPAAKTTRK